MLSNVIKVSLVGLLSIGSTELRINYEATNVLTKSINHTVENLINYKNNEEHLIHAYETLKNNADYEIRFANTLIKEKNQIIKDLEDEIAELQSSLLEAQKKPVKTESVVQAPTTPNIPQHPQVDVEIEEEVEEENQEELEE